MSVATKITISAGKWRDLVCMAKAYADCKRSNRFSQGTRCQHLTRDSNHRSRVPKSVHASTTRRESLPCSSECQRRSRIAYETVTSAQGTLPLLVPMSQVAGRMAPQVGAHVRTQRSWLSAGGGTTCEAHDSSAESARLGRNANSCFLSRNTKIRFW
jgi:hypothetical protein